MSISAVLVTRGDVDLSLIIDTLPYDDLVIWDNSKRKDLGIYGRYAAIAEAKGDLIYTQDDDVVVSCHEELAEAHRKGAVALNYPKPFDIPWVARGAIFERELPALAFERYWASYPNDDYFRRQACDGIFTLLSTCLVIDCGSDDLPHGFDPGRVSTTPGWYDRDRPEIQRRCHELRRTR